ncbi:MAG TPA: class I SAM-dependent methyltransferase, partial [Longimicrobiaceae bacterium]
MSVSASPAARTPFPYPVAGRADGAVRLVVGGRRAGWIDAVPGDLPGRRVLAVTCGSLGRSAADPVAGVRAFLERELELGAFDLVYATGVCEHLARPVARALAERLFDHLAPG